MTVAGSRTRTISIIVTVLLLSLLVLLLTIWFAQRRYQSQLIGSRLFVQQVLIQLAIGQDLQQDLMLDNEENRNGVRLLKERLLSREPYRVELGSWDPALPIIPYSVIFEGNDSFFVLVKIPTLFSENGQAHYYYIWTLRASIREW